MSEYYGLSQKQTVLHDPDNGQIGNCFSAVIANLLRIPVSCVPTFVGEGWQKRLNKWLRPYGVAYLAIAPFDFADHGIEGCHHDQVGPTNRFGGTVSHATCAVDGVIAFDPHPDNTGLTETTEFGLFICLRPWVTRPVPVLHSSKTEMHTFLDLIEQVDNREAGI